MKNNTNFTVRQAKLEISAEENMIENVKHFNDRLKEAKTILTLNEAGIPVEIIASRIRMAESRAAEIVALGLEKTEIQLRRWYEVPNTPVETKTENPVVEDVQTVETPVVETTPAVNEPVVPGVQAVRVKGGVKMAEEKIVAMLKAKGAEGMPVKELKAAAPEGINPATWVIRVSKLKTAGTITVVDGVARAV